MTEQVVINKREMTMRADGTIFCSLTKEEQEAEHKEMIARFEKYHEVMLAKEAAGMSKEDFIKKYNEYVVSEERFANRLARWHNEVEWDDWKYEQEMYDNDKKPSVYKLKRWRYYNVITDHITAGILISLFAYGYIANDMFFLVFGGAFGLMNLISVGFKWKHFFETKDTMENLNKW